MSTVYIPFDRTKISVLSNETVTDTVINRCTNRLLYNDKKLLEYLNNVGSTVFLSGLTGEIDPLNGVGKVGIDYFTVNDLFIEYGFYPTSGITHIVQALDYGGTKLLSTENNGDLLALSADTSGFMYWVNSGIMISPEHTLESHLNVQINDTLSDGQTLIWNDTFKLWENSTVGGNFKTNVKFLTLTNYHSGSIIDLTTKEFNSTETFNLENFECNDYGVLSATVGINYKNLRGIFVECTLPNTYSGLSATYLPSDTLGVLINTNGTSTHVERMLKYVPCTSNTSLTFEVENNATYKFVGAYLETMRQIYQEIEILYLKGNVQTVDSGGTPLTYGNFTSGYINGGTYSEPGTYTTIRTNLSSEIATTAISSWSSVLPIFISEYVTKTEITYYGNNTNIESNGFVVIDWENNSVNGYVNGQDFSNYWSFVLTGQVSSTPITGILLNNSAAFSDELSYPQFCAMPGIGYSNYIERLPRFDYSFLSKCAVNVAYTIKNYKTYYQPSNLVG